MNRHPLFLGGGQASAKVHPVVLLSILDHHIRRNEDQTRVVGTLLGHVVDGVVHIRNCFPIPSSNSGDVIHVNMDFHRSMYELYQRVSNKEVIVGWYTTGNTLDDDCVAIHELFSMTTVNPVMLLVDTQMLHEQMGISAYVSTSVTIDQKSCGVQFRQIKLDIVASVSERIGVDILTRARDSEDHKTFGSSSLMADTDRLQNTIKSVISLLDRVLAYVENVLEGKVVGSKAVGRYLVDVINKIPRIDPQAFEEMFTGNLQDLLMVVYLSNLTRTQVALADRLQSVA
eukprot:TRINITY_DN560_c0_g6_i1.p1 TRINITY_DN560_c0_g6~~TRINITY_DN560_c0_g6_i1.p1  ORF type:complete len:286 (+),score=76.96 TRINITY_DN560_c0_g6_i1:80-937(+)